MKSKMRFLSQPSKWHIAFFFLVFCFGYMSSSEAAKICFCHGENNPHSICTDKVALQNGHYGHGDLDFGCECGDGECQEYLGEDCGTCPQDCGNCGACGDNQIDDGEECGEPGLDACPDGEECMGCRCAPKLDECPDDPDKLIPGLCGCGVPDIDTDGDETPDCNDMCPDDPEKINPGICGCGIVDEDSDGDETPDCNDQCPNNPDKIEPGICGCDAADTDSDGDGVLDCNDQCPSDAAKTTVGQCGCGNDETDSDGDGIADCADNCPTDPDKASPGVCGCGVSDVDADGNGIADCNDFEPIVGDTDSGNPDVLEGSGCRLQSGNVAASVTVLGAALIFLFLSLGLLRDHRNKE